jgi:hypothetical protein
MEINRYHIFVNTALRNSGTTSDFSINVNPPLVKAHASNYFVAQIVSVEIPYSWLQVNSTNNTLPVALQINGGAYSYATLVITEGNYTALSLSTALFSALKSAFPTITFTDGTVYDPTSGKYTFGILGAGAYTSVVVSYNFSANTFLARMFGCLAATNIIFGYASLTYNNVSGSTNCNVNPVSSVFIRSSNLKQLKNQENLVTGFSQDPSDILCKIQVYTPPRSWIFYNGELGLSAKITNPIIDKLDIYLSDNYSFALKMNNNDWSFRITFIEYEPHTLSFAEQIARPLNTKFGEYHVTKPVPQIEEKTPIEEKIDVAPSANLRRFQK